MPSVFFFSLFALIFLLVSTILSSNYIWIRSSIDRTCAFNEKSSDQIESDLLDDVPSGNEHYQAGERSLSKLIHPNFHKRRSDSAEKYFHWASKTNRK